jgi:hypothetical protein
VLGTETVEKGGLVMRIERRALPCSMRALVVGLGGQGRLPSRSSRVTPVALTPPLPVPPLVDVGNLTALFTAALPRWDDEQGLLGLDLQAAGGQRIERIYCSWSATHFEITVRPIAP